jgi:hypothetical protein
LRVLPGVLRAGDPPAGEKSAAIEAPKPCPPSTGSRIQRKDGGCGAFGSSRPDDQQDGRDEPL